MKKRSIILATIAVITATALTSCGGNDNKGIMDDTVNVGTVTVSMNDNNSNAGNATDIIDNTISR